MNGSFYDVGLACLNGHRVNDSAQSRPQHNASFCQSCGEPTISACPACSAAIRGEYHVPGVAAISTWTAPRHCHNCGKPHPWTERRTAALRKCFLPTSADATKGAKQKSDGCSMWP
ncbi:MAG: DUF2321 domain-containing protein [Planctomycetia bacterium]|nr:DUF2321 domain-containing protein [Planctomycetia bacterium]